MADTTYTIEGQIKVIFETQSIGDKGFRKREFVISTPGRHTQDVKLQAVKDRCDTLDNFQPGDGAVVKFDVVGNEKDGKYYVSLEAWAITHAGANGQPRERAPETGSTTEQAKAALRQAASKGMDSLKNTFMGFTPALKKELTAFKDSLKPQAEAADAKPAPSSDEDDLIPF